MRKKMMITLLAAIVALVVGVQSSVVSPTVHADHISIFDMNDRNASAAWEGEGSGVSVVRGSNIDLRIEASNLTPLYVYEVGVSLRKDGDPVSGMFAHIVYPVASDQLGVLTFEKPNLNLEFLPPGNYRVDFEILDPERTEPGRTEAGKAFHAKWGRDLILSCQPATKIVILK